MSNLDIVARLQLNAAQFTSQTGASFADMKTRAASTAQEVRSSFASSLTDVQRMAQQALTMPRQSGGGLDLSAEIKSLKEAAAASDQRAIAARELSIAYTTAAESGRGETEQLRLSADASAVASLAEEKRAAAIRLRVEGLEVANAELSRSTSLTKADTDANEESNASFGRASIARMEFTHVLRAVGDGYAAGIPLTQLFSMEIGRSAEALSFWAQSGTKAARTGEEVGRGMVAAGTDVAEAGVGVAASASKFGLLQGAALATGEFLAGPWGIAVMAGVAVLGPLIGKLSDTDEAAKKAAEDGLKEFEDRQRSLAAAIDATTGKMDTQARYMAHLQLQQIPGQIATSNQTVGQKTSDMIGAVQGQISKDWLRSDDEDLKWILANRGKDPFSLNEAVQTAAKANPAYRELAASISQMAGEAYNAAEKAKALKAEQLDLNTQMAGGTVLSAKVIEQRTAEALATTAVEKAQLRVNAAKQKTADIDRAMTSGAAKDAALLAAGAEEIAAGQALASAQEAAKKKPKVSLGDQLSAEQGQRLLSSAQSYSGLDENRDKGALEQLFSAAHENVDPSKIAWCAAFVNAVLASNNLPTTGNLSARSFLGYGSSTDKPEKGDIVVLRGSGGPASGHVGFFDGLDGKGNVRVTGGNQGNQVSTESFKRSDVLGFRRAPSAADSYKAEEEAGKKAEEQQRRLGDEIARISAQWDEQPRLIDKASLETTKLDEIIADLSKQPVSAETTKLIASAQAAKQSIVDGLERPFDEFRKSQLQSLAVQQLQLQGRDVEAQALQWALQLQEKQGPLDDAHLAKLLQMAEQQQRISDALEDQRRVISLYGGSVADVQHDVDTFLNDLETRPQAAFGNIASGFVDSFRKLQNGLISEQLFGGMQREIERYVAQQSGGTTPADMLKQQLGSAGDALKAHVDDTGDALADFTKAVRYTTEELAGIGPASHMVPAGYQPKELLSPSTLADLKQGAAQEAGRPANDNNPLVDATHELTHATVAAAEKHMSAADLYDKMGASLVTNFEHLVGVRLPKGMETYLKDNLGTVLQGASMGQLGGGVFAAITGGKQNTLTSSIGGVLGESAGKALKKPMEDIFGKTIGGMAGPLGGIIGGVLGNLVGGLFTSIKWADSSVSMNANGRVVGNSSNGNGTSALANATGEASSVAAGINQLAQQLGAKITSLPAMTLGTWNGNYRVADLATTQGLNANNFQMGQNLHDFGGDQQAAIEYAVRYSISHAVITGISQASKNILADGSEDLQSAVSKALLIESVPKDLKAMLDPVGAAVDALNLKWQQTVDALKEGGATADQMAQAQRLYNLQLDQTKASTDAADKTLQDFLTSLKVGSDSPYSLRDQEATAKANLQPFLDAINAGSAIDQSKYQTAAQSFLDVERQLYGSTQQYFDAMGAVQDATNKAISTIDNATPVTTSVDSPFIQKTADNTSTAADLLSQMSGQLGDITSLLASLGISSSGGGFIGTDRLFAAA